MDGVLNGWGWVKPDCKFAEEVRRQNRAARQEFRFPGDTTSTIGTRGRLSARHYCGKDKNGREIMLSVSEIAQRCEVGVQSIYGRLRRGVTGPDLLRMHRHADLKRAA